MEDGFKNLRSNKVTSLLTFDFRLSTRATRGFSLVEMIIYIAIFSIISIVTVNGILMMMRSFSFLRLSQNINQSATSAMERMSYEIRNAYDIDTANSTLGTSPGRLTLLTKDSGGNPTTVEFYTTSTPYDVWRPVDSSQGYSGIAMSADGKYQTAVTYYGYIYVSSDYGVSWAQKGQSFDYDGVAMSSTGQYQTAVVLGGYIYISSDYGATWTQEGTAQAYTGVAMSSDGNYQTAVSHGFVYSSSNHGVTWTQTTAPSINYHGVAMSSTGQYQLAVLWCDGINYSYKSTDYGVTWSPASSLGMGCNSGAAMSSSGQYQVVVSGSGGRIKVSSDYGDTWTQKGVGGYYAGVAVSSDGRYQSEVATNGYVYMSSDFGDNWTQKGDVQKYYGIAMSSDGQQQAAVSETNVYEYVPLLYHLNMKVGGVDQGSLMVISSGAAPIFFTSITTTNSKAVKVEMSILDSRQNVNKYVNYFDTIILRGTLH